MSRPLQVNKLLCAKVEAELYSNMQSGERISFTDIAPAPHCAELQAALRVVFRHYRNEGCLSTVKHGVYRPGIIPLPKNPYYAGLL